MTGMVKNQKLPKNILTPTTKAADHDVPITPDEVWCLVLSLATSFFTMAEVIVKDEFHRLHCMDTDTILGMGMGI